MPTFTAIALDSLLEPGPSKSTDKPPPRPKQSNPNPSSMLERRNGKSVAEMKVLRPQINPELYATPESAPLPLSPSAFSPSPYVINHKRRGPRLLNSFSKVNVSSGLTSKEEVTPGKIDDLETKVVGTNQNTSFAITGSTSLEEERRNCNCENNEELQTGHTSNDWVRESDLVDDIASNPDGDEESEVFFDPQESMSIASNTDEESVYMAESSQKFQTPKTEFFDSSSDEQSSRHDREEFVHKLSEMRLNLLMEIDRRKQAEEALSKMRCQWLDIKHKLSSEGLRLHEDPMTAADSDPAEDLSQQIKLARFVYDAIGRGTMRAEIEMKMEAEIESKNFEINRLSDRIRYYEIVNHAMSQRNQEAVEMGRRERLRRRRRKQKWVWGSVAAAITIGTAALAWSYLPSERGSTSSNHPDQKR